MRNYDHPACVKISFGNMGIGKTTHFVKELKQQRARSIYIYDHKDREFSRKLKKEPVTDEEGLIQASARGGYILYDPSEMFPGKKVEGWKFFCDFLYYSIGPIVKGRKIVCLDETQDFVDTRTEPEEMIRLFHDGRSHEIDGMFIGQAANCIHARLRNTFTEVFVFQQMDVNAIGHLKDWGFDEAKVRALRPGEWLWRNMRNGMMACGGEAFDPSPGVLPIGGKSLNEQPATTSSEKI